MIERDSLDITFVSHDAGRAGAQRFLLTFIRWLCERKGIRPRIILRRGGALVDEFRCLGPVLEIEPLLQNGFEQLRSEICDFSRGSVFAYINTLVPGDIAEFLFPLQIPVITHAHEMEHAIQRWCNPEHLEALLRITDYFVAASRPVAENLQQKHGVDRKRIRTIHEFIRCSNHEFGAWDKAMARREKQLADTDFVVFGCGTMDWRKGPDLFIEVARSTVHDFGLSKITFCWLGAEGPGFERQELQKQIDQLGLASHVRFLGEVADPSSYFPAGDAFILTSREDPFPLVCLEAADNGLPIVCFDEAGGMPDFVKNDAGYVVPFANTKAMAHKVLRLYENPEERHRLGAAACARVRSNHDVSDGGEQVLQVCLNAAVLRQRTTLAAQEERLTHSGIEQERLAQKLAEAEAVAAVRKQEIAQKEFQLSQLGQEMEGVGRKAAELEITNVLQKQAVTEREYQAARLREETERLNRRVTELEVALGLQERLVSDKDLQLGRLSDDITKLNRKTADLESIIEIKTELVSQKETELLRSYAERDERNRAVAELQVVLLAKEAQLHEVSRSIEDLTDERNRAVAELQMVLPAKEAQLHELNQKVKDLEEAQSGILWRVLCSYRSVKSYCFPPGTRRRAVYDGYLEAIKKAFGSNSKNSLVAAPLMQESASHQSLESGEYGRNNDTQFQKDPGLLKEMFYGLDSIAMRGSRVYGWGWLFHENTSVSAMRLVIKTRHEMHYFPCQYGLLRQDVSNTYAFDAAKNSGFVIQGRLPQEKLIDIFLEVDLSEGGTRRLDCEELQRLLSSSEQRTIGMNQKGLRKIYRYGRQVVSGLARGDLRGLYYKTQRKIEHVRLDGRAIAFSLGEFMNSIGPNKHQDFALIIDHNMGGGTNLYRTKLIEEQLEIGRAVVVLTYDVWRLRYALKFHDRERDLLFHMESLDSLNSLVETVRIREIFLNNTVSFDDPLMIVTLLLHIKKATGAELTIAVHDYFAICPSWTLIDDRGLYCGVPSIARCRECLPTMRGALSFWVDNEDIDQWREVWGRCLVEANRILCFSRSSIDLLARAYPHLESSKITFRPHTIDEFPKTKVRLSMNGPLHIGIVGEISIAKGAQIVREMNRLILERGLPIKMTVIGTIEGVSESTIVHITGPYKREELPTIIEKTGAHVFFVPAIWPETFSYVTAELMQMGLAVASFNLGAQAERLGTYHRGLIIEDTTSEAALDQLIAFHAKLVRSQREEFQIQAS